MKKKILIVEDRLDLICFLRSQVQNLDYDSVVAVNGKEAVDLATSQLPDLILMDIMLPVMDGLQATRLIREHPNTQSTPILAMTARATSEDREECFRSGCDDFLAKPFTVKELTSIIEKLLNQNSNLSTPALLLQRISSRQPQ